MLFRLIGDVEAPMAVDLIEQGHYKDPSKLGILRAYGAG